MVGGRESCSRYTDGLGGFCGPLLHRVFSLYHTEDVTEGLLCFGAAEQDSDRVCLTFHSLREVCS